MSRKSSRKQSRRSPHVSPTHNPETPPNFFPGVSSSRLGLVPPASLDESSENWSPYPFEKIPTRMLKRDFLAKLDQLHRLEAEFPGTTTDSAFDWHDTRGPLTPARQISLLRSYVDLAKIELLKRGAKLPPREPPEAAGRNVAIASQAPSQATHQSSDFNLTSNPVVGRQSMKPEAERRSVDTGIKGTRRGRPPSKLLATRQAVIRKIAATGAMGEQYCHGLVFI